MPVRAFMQRIKSMCFRTLQPRSCHKRIERKIHRALGREIHIQLPITIPNLRIGQHSPLVVRGLQPLQPAHLSLQLGRNMQPPKVAHLYHQVRRSQNPPELINLHQPLRRGSHHVQLPISLPNLRISHHPSLVVR
jgi:hypothetical protein